MKLEHIERSIVVVADRHNPSILHPSFLTKQNIVEEDLELAEPPLTTPDISIASFINGLRITVDHARLQVTNLKASENEVDLPKVASAYLKELPHVGYKSVGCNLFMFLEQDNAESFLIDKFIKEGSWNQDNILLGSIGLRFVYPIDSSTINISYDAGRITNKKEKAGILIRGNYHSDTNSIEEAVESIEQFDSKINHIIEYVEAAFKDN